MNKDPSSIAIEKLLDLRGRRALVTGASGNVGAGIARRLASAGADIVIHGLSNSWSLAELENELLATGTDVHSAQADLSTDDGVETLFSSIEKSGNAVDLVVNNAAIQPVVALEEMSDFDWQSVIAANLHSVFSVTRAAAARLRSAGRSGAIVNIASIEGSDPAVGHAHYATSKSGVLMFTRAAALEYGEYGIRVNAVSPGLIRRERIETDWPDGVARWTANAPLQRLGEAADVADAVLFLLSPAARWISGANLVVDGGMSAVSRW